MASKVGAVTIGQILNVIWKTAIILLALSVSILLTVGSFIGTKRIVEWNGDRICGEEGKTNFCKNTETRANIWAIVSSVSMATFSLAGVILLFWVFFLKAPKVEVESTFLPF